MEDCWKGWEPVSPIGLGSKARKPAEDLLRGLDETHPKDNPSLSAIQYWYTISMNIRLAKAKDYREVIDLYGIFVGDDRYQQPNSDSFNKVVGSKSGYMYVAEAEKRIVGYATFSIRYVVRYPEPIAELDELFVTDAYRRHGTGKLLMDAIMQKAKALGCCRIYIESHYKHEGAHKFYEKLGFTNYGYHFLKKL